MEPKFILTDLDGTLLQSNASLSDYTIKVLLEALDQGIVISYATARSYLSSNRIVSVIPWKYPLVLYNGALIFDPTKNKVIDGHWLDRGITNQIIELGRNFSLSPLLFGMDEEDRERVYHEKLVRTGDLHFLQSRPNDPRFAEVDRLECPESCRTLMVTYIGLLEELEPLKREIEQKYGKQVHIHIMKDSYIEHHYFLECSHSKANKKDGLKMWAKLVNCNPEDVIVFGDNLNDLGMFEAAGTKVAVSNAQCQLMGIATHVVESNDEDAVAKYIKGLLAMETV
jgi:Cof subfamily protein (haloacid dehalogenase superfamily)